MVHSPLLLIVCGGSTGGDGVAVVIIASNDGVAGTAIKGASY
jgi:hypothetical protein